MRPYLIYLVLLLLCFNVKAQFHLDESVEYTEFTSVDSLIKFWKSHPEEVDDLVGVYEFLTTNEPVRSTISYVLGVKKENEVYKIIMLGGKYGDKDVGKGGIKAIVQKTPTDEIYNMRWRMADATYIEKGYIIKEGLTITVHLSKYP